MRHTHKAAAFVTAILLAGLATACGSSATAPTATVVPETVKRVAMAYEINLVSAVIVNQLNAQYPSGVQLSPVEAQQQFDERSIYGAPNVYYGESAPPVGSYAGTSIVIAPLTAASKETFAARDWPGLQLDATAEYYWVGRFVFAQAGR